MLISKPCIWAHNCKWAKAWRGGGFYSLVCCFFLLLVPLWCEHRGFQVSLAFLDFAVIGRFFLLPPAGGVYGIV